MTPLLFCVAAGSAAVGRFLIGAAMHSWLAVLVVNVTGSGLLGYVLAVDASPAVATVVGAGFCGTFTTYSSFAIEARAFGLRWGTLYALVTLGGAFVGVAVGAALA